MQFIFLKENKPPIIVIVNFAVDNDRGIPPYIDQLEARTFLDKNTTNYDNTLTNIWTTTSSTSIEYGWENVPITCARSHVVGRMLIRDIAKKSHKLLRVEDFVNTLNAASISSITWCNLNKDRVTIFDTNNSFNTFVVTNTEFITP